MFRGMYALPLLLFPILAGAQDPIKTDGDKYNVIMENACVRVLDYKDLPGEETQQHEHPKFVLYALGAFERTITLPSGEVMTRKFEAGDVLWSDGQTHVGANIGETPTHVLLVELKEAVSDAGKCSAR